jgi:hypothetical protein
MDSSPDEAMRLLHKWKKDSAIVSVAFSDGTEDRGPTFALTFLGAVSAAAGSALEIARDSLCSLTLDISLASFKYLEPEDRALPLSDADRSIATRLISATFSIMWPDGKLCTISALAEGAAFARE